MLIEKLPNLLKDLNNFIYGKLKGLITREKYKTEACVYI